MKTQTEDPPADKGWGYRRDSEGRLLCPCCGHPQPHGSAIAYCDDCNTDTCGHWLSADGEPR